MTERHALCIGINAYPGAALNGCVNDALDWAEALTARGYRAVVMLDKTATKTAIVETLTQMVANTGYGDRLVLTFSGHGSRIKDKSGDETDGYDEVIVTLNDKGDGFDFIIDDDLAKILGDRKRGARVTVIADSCYSGSVTRFVDLTGGPRGDDGELTEAVRADTQVRFLPPAKLLGAKAAKGTPDADGDTPARKVGSSTGAVLIAGCEDDEFCYDTSFNGRPNGAFTRTAIDALTRWAPDPGTLTVVGHPVDVPLTYNRWFANIRATLPSDEYPQSPRVTGSSHQRHYLALD